MVLELLQAVADHGRRQTQVPAGGGQAAEFDHAGEHLHVLQQHRHVSLPIRSIVCFRLKLLGEPARFTAARDQPSTDGGADRPPKSREGVAAMEPILWEWLSMAVRWLHVIAGIAWIGSSFYFVHLDSSLKQRPGLPDGRRRRRLAGPWRRLLPHGQVSGGAGADAGVADLVQVGGLRHLALAAWVC